MDRFKDEHWTRLETDAGITYKEIDGEKNQIYFEKPVKEVTIVRRKSTFL